MEVVEAERGDLQTHALFAQLVEGASSCGVLREAQALAGAISPAEQTELLRVLRGAARACQSAYLLELVEQVEGSLLGGECNKFHAEAKLTSCIDLVHTTGQPPGMPVLSREDQAEIQLARAQDLPPEPPPERRSAWLRYILDLQDRAEDKMLLEIALRPEHAGGPAHLARLSGLALASISRLRHKPGRTASIVFRNWLATYLMRAPGAPPPAPLESVRGAPPKAGAIAPKIWVTDSLHAKVEAKQREGHTVRMIFNAAMKHFLAIHPAGSDLPEPPEKGLKAIRGRVDKKVLADFDARVGGPTARIDHLRTAISEYLSDASGTRKRAKKVTARAT